MVVTCLRRARFNSSSPASLRSGVVLEDGPPFIAPGRHVVHSPFVLDPLRPHHTAILSPSPTLHKRQFAMQDPLSIKIRPDPAKPPYLILEIRPYSSPAGAKKDDVLGFIGTFVSDEKEKKRRFNETERAPGFLQAGTFSVRGEYFFT